MRRRKKKWMEHGCGGLRRHLGRPALNTCAHIHAHSRPVMVSSVPEGVLERGRVWWLGRVRAVVQKGIF